MFGSRKYCAVSHFHEHTHTHTHARTHTHLSRFGRFGSQGVCASGGHSGSSPCMPPVLPSCALCLLPCQQILLKERSSPYYYGKKRERISDIMSDRATYNKGFCVRFRQVTLSFWQMHVSRSSCRLSSTLHARPSQHGVPKKLNLYGHPFAGHVWERQYEEVLFVDRNTSHVIFLMHLAHVFAPHCCSRCLWCAFV